VDAQGVPRYHLFKSVFNYYKWERKFEETLARYIGSGLINQQQAEILRAFAERAKWECGSTGVCMTTCFTIIAIVLLVVGLTAGSLFAVIFGGIVLLGCILAIVIGPCMACSAQNTAEALQKEYACQCSKA
jgi:hypothetical protein